MSGKWSLMMKKMMSDFENYMLKRMSTASPFEREINEAILSLYKKGFLDITMDDEEPLIEISDFGKSAYASMLLYQMTPMGEA